jgi:ribosome maturation factor RimP
VLYRAKERSVEEEKLEESLSPVAQGLGLSLVELSVSRHKSGVTVKAVVFKAPTGVADSAGGSAAVGIKDCAGFHRAIMPRLELAFGEDNLSVEVSSPGTNRQIKDGAEASHYAGCAVKCWDTAISDWKQGILESVTETHIILNGKVGMEKLMFENIAKAKLDGEADAAVAASATRVAIDAVKTANVANATTAAKAAGAAKVADTAKAVDAAKAAT